MNRFMWFLPGVMVGLGVALAFPVVGQTGPADITKATALNLELPGGEFEKLSPKTRELLSKQEGAETTLPLAAGETKDLTTSVKKTLATAKPSVAVAVPPEEFLKIPERERKVLEKFKKDAATDLVDQVALQACLDDLADCRADCPAKAAPPAKSAEPPK